MRYQSHGKASSDKFSRQSEGAHTRSRTQTHPHTPRHKEKVKQSPVRAGRGQVRPAMHEKQLSTVGVKQGVNGLWQQSNGVTPCSG